MNPVTSLDITYLDSNLRRSPNIRTQNPHTSVSVEHSLYEEMISVPALDSVDQDIRRDIYPPALEGTDGVAYEPSCLYWRGEFSDILQGAAKKFRLVEEFSEYAL